MISNPLSPPGEPALQSAWPKVSVGLIDSAFTRPMIEGRVRTEGVRVDAQAVEPSDLFFRQLKNAEFDCSEISLSSLCIKHDAGDRTWWALPVFTSRNFYHSLMLVRRDAGIDSPQDLRGKRVGVPEYQQTAAVWARGVLAQDFGIQPWDIDWYMERLPAKSHAFSTGSSAPSNVRLNHIPESSSIVEMLLEGTLDATLFYFGPTTLDRSVMSEAAALAVQPLFPDRAKEGARFYKGRGFIPVNHGMAVRRSLVEDHPWLPRKIYDAMRKAKDLAEREARAFIGAYASVGLLPPETARALTQDLMPYGVEANRAPLETLMRYLEEQGLTSRRLDIEEVFAAGCD